MGQSVCRSYCIKERDQRGRRRLGFYSVVGISKRKASVEVWVYSLDCRKNEKEGMLMMMMTKRGAQRMPSRMFRIAEIRWCCFGQLQGSLRARRVSHFLTFFSSEGKCLFSRFNIVRSEKKHMPGSKSPTTATQPSRHTSISIARRSAWLSRYAK